MPSQTETQSKSATAAREEMCGPRPGDRRVRIQRQPRSVGRKIASIVRRTLSH